jgi:hypothetical protein
MKLFISILIFACATSLIKAETLDEHFGLAPGQLTPANVRELTGYSTMLAAYHTWQMSLDMDQREKEVQADKDAYNKYLLAYWQKCKAETKAREMAEAAAKQAEIDKARTQSHTWVTVYGPHGDTSIRYDGQGNPTDRIDSTYGINRSQSTYHDLEQKNK